MYITCFRRIGCLIRSVFSKSKSTQDIREHMVKIEGKKLNPELNADVDTYASFTFVFIYHARRQLLII